VFNKILNDSNNDVSNKYLAKTQSFVIFLSHDFDYESKIANKKIQEWFTYFFFRFRIVQSISFSSNWHILHFDGKTCYVTSLLIGTENYYQQDHLR
jgi:hypothetical protein